MLSGAVQRSYPAQNSAALIKAANFLLCTKCDPIFKGWICTRQAERRQRQRAKTHSGCFRLLLSERADGC